MKPDQAAVVLVLTSDIRMATSRSTGELHALESGRIGLSLRRAAAKELVDDRLS
jgi:hypothetical protein